MLVNTKRPYPWQTCHQQPSPLDAMLLQVLTAASSLCETSSTDSVETKQNLQNIVNSFIQSAQMSSTHLLSDQVSQVLKVLAASTGLNQLSISSVTANPLRRLLTVTESSSQQMQQPGWFASMRHALSNGLMSNRRGRQLAQTTSTTSSTTNAEVQSTMKALASLLAASATPATGYLSSGSSGLYLSVANLLGSTYGAEPVAVGEVVTSSGSNKVALPSAVQNVVVQMLSSLTGNCSDESGSVTACADSIVSVVLQYYADPTVVIDVSLVDSSSTASRRLLDAAVLNNSTDTATQLQDLELISGAVVVSVDGAPTEGGLLPCDNSTVVDSSNSSTNSSLPGPCGALVTIPVTGTVSTNDSKALVGLRVDETGIPLAPNTTNPDVVLSSMTNSNTTAQVGWRAQHAPTPMMLLLVQHVGLNMQTMLSCESINCQTHRHRSTASTCQHL